MTYARSCALLAKIAPSSGRECPCVVTESLFTCAIATVSAAAAAAAAAAGALALQQHGDHVVASGLAVDACHPPLPAVHPHRDLCRCHRCVRSPGSCNTRLSGDLLIEERYWRC
ncbi:Protein of unknown function [Gryllus bimaculatus]|nr:Protein of unknown function [Gryllus bimaculatus]